MMWLGFVNLVTFVKGLVGKVTKVSLGKLPLIDTPLYVYRYS